MKQTIVVAVKVPCVLRAEDLFPYVRRCLAGSALEVTGILVQPGGLDENGNALLYVRAEAEEADAEPFMRVRRVGDHVRVWTIEGFINRQIAWFIDGNETCWQEEYLTAHWRSLKFRPYGAAELLGEMASGLSESLAAPAYLIFGLGKTAGDGDLRGFLALPFMVGWLAIRPLFLPLFYWLDERRRKRLLRHPRLQLWLS